MVPGASRETSTPQCSQLNERANAKPKDPSEQSCWTGQTSPSSFRSAPARPAHVPTADQPTFAGVNRIRLDQDTRKRLTKLAAGDHLALPPSVVDYLDRLRGLGMREQYIEMERDAWIMLAAKCLS